MNQLSPKPTLRQTESTPMEQIILDCDHILTSVGGDPELLIQLCSTFLNELPIRMKSLHAAIRDRNYQATESALHRLRNCLIVLDSGPVSLTAETLETAVRGGHIRQVEREWKRLERQLQFLVPQVQRLLLEMATPTSAVQ